MNRIRGLDAIRYVCALWVLVWHYGVPVPFGHSGGSRPVWLFDSLLHISFNGTAAVVVFFIISGFAIHYPFRHGEKPNWTEYFLRRYLRIGIPLVTMLVLLYLVRAEGSEQGVLWSLYAEIIYYTLYPLLMALRWRFGWHPLLALSSLGALLLALYDPHGIHFHEYGVQLNWVIGLTSWLIGCILAEQADALTAAKDAKIWLWRFGVWAASTVFLVVAFHTPVGDSWMVTPFAVLVFFWLRQEIRHFRLHPPLEFLERAGAWSYSLYIVHLPAQRLITSLKVPIHDQAWLWSFEVGFALLLSYLFYLLVERPSHQLARRMKGFGGQKIVPPELEGGLERADSERAPAARELKL